ncbi:hypothetical protein SAMN05444007_101447 [Cribrihabitans marinus]|uniref:Lipoprotein n=1 Tax=Cribrihabitans marinus TaxID=1227549 RepID=A0A1H6RL74_9RHOB|nr:hypothetical protein [Cribrihabitans marinus]SEI52345.1 hypothetical protein SAMN05444007_101447 [Cribrihabitans marinus]
MMRPALLRLVAPALLLAGCQTTSDPAEGGFFDGVSGIASGSYDARIDTAEADVAGAQARNEALAAQIRGSESELAQLKLQILQQRNTLGTPDAATASRIDRVLNDTPGGATPDARLAALQRSISEARALSADLARLSG